MAVPWNEDAPADLRLIERNIAEVVRGIRDSAIPRSAPSVAMAQEWHRQIYRDVTLPVPYYAGEVRDSDARFPELIGYEIAVGPQRGVSAADVPSALTQFETSMQAATVAVDAVLAPGVTPSATREVVGVVQLASLAHGEWVRIHPFANGNGRTARLWVAWLAARYGLPLFLRLKPRPAESAYAVAAAASMRGDHRLMQLHLADALASALGHV